MAYYHHREANKRPPHGGLWWIFIGWWWWIFIGSWWKPLKGLLFSGPRATVRAGVNSASRARANRKLRQIHKSAAPVVVVQTPAAAAGWYVDQVDPRYVRYFDGTRWTDAVQLAPQQTPSAALPPTDPSTTG